MKEGFRKYTLVGPDGNVYELRTKFSEQLVIKIELCNGTCLIRSLGEEEDFYKHVWPKGTYKISLETRVSACDRNAYMVEKLTPIGHNWHIGRYDNSVSSGNVVIAIEDIQGQNHYLVLPKELKILSPEQMSFEK